MNESKVERQVGGSLNKDYYLSAIITIMKCVVSNKMSALKAVVGPKQSTNRNLKQIITIECTKTVIFQLLRPLDISKLEGLYNNLS